MKPKSRKMPQRTLTPNVSEQNLMNDNRPIVYLAGPMAEHPHPHVWRRNMEASIGSHILFIDPINKISVAGGLGSDSRAIIARDHYHTKKCDVLFVNMLEATIPSLGTVAEIAWAYNKGTPIIVVMEPYGNPNDHPMVNGAAAFRVDTIEEGIEALKCILRDYVPMWKQEYRRE